MPVMFATNTCPRISTLTASMSPVVKVSSSSAVSVCRYDTGEGGATVGRVYSLGVRSNEVMVDIRVISHSPPSRVIVSR
ncbi:hypothetical protein MPSYJ_07330 [Mycolicibacterium psychrotolerans]|uniref:Uncharacterized protein n=1 Tax=Mycolicibacterium psychrotolerans TaxID=216929 RepID=A0A7I7M5Y2_9MYCO|nr:hypothetical protein MPSYJ_07330 [Mycolicibacterium psychrotolerans]